MTYLTVELTVEVEKEMSSKELYLAEHYLSGPKADAILERAKGKKKKKSKSINDGSVTINEDNDLLASKLDDPDNDDPAVQLVSHSSKFKSIAPPTNPSTSTDDNPTVVEDNNDNEFKGGLKSAKQIRQENAQLRAKEDENRRVEEESLRNSNQQTIYRDQSGRKIDVKAQEIEAKRLKQERDQAEAKRMEWGKGLVQREDRDKLRKQEEAMKHKSLTKYSDDAEHNAELMDVERWNDPAAAFITKKTSSGPKKPKYTGPPPPPNRFNISPGYRWDGVDRSNGFEQKLFQSINSRKRTVYEHGKWSREDM